MDSDQAIMVRGRDGVIGSVDPSHQPEDEAEVWVRLNNGQVMRVPAEFLETLDDGSYYLPMGREQMARLEAQNSAKERSGEVVVIPVIKEDLKVTRHEKTRAVVRVHKNVKEREARVDEPGYVENVMVERVPKNEAVTDAPHPRYEGDTLVIPVLEEVLVVEKRLILKEEVRVTKVRQETHDPQSVTLRSEEVQVERIEPGSEEAGTA